MNPEILSHVLSFLILAGIGLAVARRITLKWRVTVWVVCLLGLLLADYLGVSTRIFTFIGFTIFFNNALQGFLFGLLVGQFALKRGRSPSVS